MRRADEFRRGACLGPSVLCPRLIGRVGEVGVLTERVEAADRGRGGVVALVGPAGVGKTRLAQEATDRARARGMRVLAGRAVPSESPVPYRALTDAFLAAFRSGPPPAGPELEGFGGHLGRLVPAWRRTDSGGADESPVLLAEAVVRLLRLLGAGRGCVLLLEDVHWADAETLAVVDYLTDALADEPTLCLCTSRPTGAAAEVLSRVRRRESTAQLDLDPLDDRDVDDVVAACLATESPPGDLLAFIAAHADGNPFLIEELLAGLVASGALVFDDGRWVTAGDLTPTVPFSLGDSVRQRLSTLDATTRTVIGAAAVLGRNFDWELLPGVAEVDGRTVVDALRRAVDEQLVEVEGGDFRFRHALTREAVLHELLPPERRDLSTRAWPAVERAHPGLPGPWCELAAELAEASGDPAAAAARLVESAARARDNGALASAEATARRARRLASADAGSTSAVIDDADEVLVQTLALAGKPEAATALGLPLVDRLTRAAAPAERRADLLVVLARAALVGGDAAAATTMTDRARRLVDEGQVGEALAARIEAIAAHVALAFDRLDEADGLARSAVEHASATSQPAVECEGLEVRGRVARSRSTDRSAFFEQAAATAERHGLTSWLLRARHELALQGWVNGQLQPIRDVRDLATRHGALVTVAVMDLSLADIALSSFDRDGCLAAAQRCVDASRRYGLATLPVAELWLAGAHALAGDDPGMEAAAARALEHDPDDPRILGDLWGRVRASRAIVGDDRDQLRTALDSMMTYVRTAPTTTSVFPNRVMWALLHTVEDDDHGAAARAELTLAKNLEWWPVFLACRRLVDAVARGRLDDNADAAALFDAAWEELRLFGLSTGTHQYFRVLAAEAAIRDSWGEPARWLREAEAFFADAGYDRIARRCRTLLAATGAPVPRRGRGDSVVPPALRGLGITSRELDVLHLVTEGLTNRAIAERLFLSRKTVERHLTSLFERTGIHDRHALAEFARSQTG